MHRLTPTCNLNVLPLILGLRSPLRLGSVLTRMYLFAFGARFPFSFRVPAYLLQLFNCREWPLCGLTHKLHRLYHSAATSQDPPYSGGVGTQVRAHLFRGVRLSIRTLAPEAHRALGLAEPGGTARGARTGRGGRAVLTD